MLLKTSRHIPSQKCCSASSQLILDTQIELAFYVFVMGHRLLTTGIAFPCSLKDSDTHFAILSRWHIELQISVLDISLTEVEHWLLHKVASDGREGAVSSDDQVSTSHYRFLGTRPASNGKF